MMRTSAIAIALFFIVLPASAQEEPPPPPPPPVEATPEPPKAKPSIVIDAKDDTGRDVRGVTVFIDDKAVSYELTTKPFDLDPGLHTIAVQRNDGPRQRATTTLTLAEGDVNHAVHLTFEKTVEEAPALEKPVNAPIAPRIIAGLGVAGVVTGVVLLLVRPAMPTNCNPDTGHCTRLAAQTDAQFTDDRDAAGQNRGFLAAGLATLISGAALTAGGIVRYVLERKPFETTKPRAMIAPWLRETAGGLSVRASF